MSEELTKTKLLPIQGKDMDSIMQNLETGVAELFTSERYQEYLKTMSKFHNYSFNNTLLIAMQRPDATLVTGYRNWQSMGRQVKKGEKGITIIAPAPIKRKKEQAVLDQDQKPVIGPDGKPKTEEVEVTLPCFKAITVFDLSLIHILAKEDIHVYSVDECFMDVTRYLSLYHLTAKEMAQKLMDAVMEETGITATAGIGTNLYLAKIAMDIVAKHIEDHIGMLDEISYREQLWGHKPLSDFWRIGSRTERKLAGYGIQTMGDIAPVSYTHLDVYKRQQIYFRDFVRPL